MNRQAIVAPADPGLKRHRLCGLLDELVSARWKLSEGLRDNPDFSPILIAHLQRTGCEIDVTIIALKARLEELGPPP